MQNKAQIMDWTGIWDPWVHLSALPLTCWVTLGKLFHLSMHKGPIYKKEVVVHVSVVLNTCVRNAAEKAGFELNKWPSPFQFFMLYHLLVLPCTLGRLLKADGAFSKGSQRVVPLLLLVTKTWLMLLLLILTTADYSLPGLSHFSQFFPWSDPKHCCQNLVRIHPVTRLWLSLVSEHRLPASWHAVFWSPSLLGSTYQQCQMCCRRGLSLGLSPALAFPPASASCPKPAPPFLATSSLHGRSTAGRNAFVLSYFLKYLFGLWQYSCFNFENITYSSKLLAILLLEPHWFPGSLCTSIVSVAGIK